jgi:hypothetical protein
VAEGTALADSTGAAGATDVLALALALAEAAALGLFFGENNAHRGPRMKSSDVRWLSRKRILHEDSLASSRRYLLSLREGAPSGM